MKPTKENILSNEELVALAQQGDHQSFCRLYIRNFNTLVDVADYLLKDRETAKDLVQDVFCQLWNNTHAVTDQSLFLTYMHSVVKNKALDRLRRLKRVRNAHSRFNFNIYSYNESHYLIEHKELLYLLKKKIQGLPFNIRKVFVLSRIYHMNHAEISTHLGMPLNTVKTNMKRAIHHLKNLLPNVYDLKGRFFKENTKPTISRLKKFK